jgi:leucyl-tRNA synthetase
MKRYNPTEIEQKWQAIWEQTQPYTAHEDDKPSEDARNVYLAEMFPYPSGAGLHVGHVRNFTIVDVLARFHRQCGHNVLRTFGYDTFGLPAENYAIKTGVSPQSATETNIGNFRRQLKRVGYAIDWTRELSTSDPAYYRWTQWCFLQLYKAGLAYQSESFQWWCPFDKTVLANEQVENGHCWRCGSEVEKKKMKQWFFKITAYADELLDEIDNLDWPDKIKTMQKNWIGRSEGAEVDFAVEGSKHKVKVFTTRPDTLAGATFIVLAPEHNLIRFFTNSDTRDAVHAYQEAAMKKSEIERQENKDKTGVFTGSYAINPITGDKMPIWVADYVLIGYGEGAIMAVPAHDERDYDFAQKFQLPVKQVIASDEELWTGEGQLLNSGDFTGLESAEARDQIIAWLTKSKIGKKRVTYRMRDWLISRQRYWGAPIPIAYDKDGKPHAIPEDQLPVLLPTISDYKPDDSGRSALAKSPEFMKVIIDGEEMTRETDTMDGYACSSWYLWRYTDPHNSERAWDPAKANYWNPIDFYVGGDHAVAHLLYVRFWCKFLADQGLLDFREPVKKLLYNGYINAPDGKKMSKSKGNVIDPLEIINEGYGADTLRTYEMFIGPYDLDAAWSVEAIGGVYRFLNRAWTITSEYLDWTKAQSEGIKLRSTTDLRRLQHITIKKVTEDLHRNCFNTAVAALMEYVNELYKARESGFSADFAEPLVALSKLLAPFAPHLCSELLEQLGSDDKWPTWDEALTISNRAEIVVQVNGKLRSRFTVDTEILADQEKLKQLALSDEKVLSAIAGKEVVKIIVVPHGKLINLVIR